MIEVEWFLPIAHAKNVSQSANEGWNKQILTYGAQTEIDCVEPFLGKQRLDQHCPIDTLPNVSIGNFHVRACDLFGFEWDPSRAQLKQFINYVKQETNRGRAYLQPSPERPPFQPNMSAFSVSSSNLANVRSINHDIVFEISVLNANRMFFKPKLFLWWWVHVRCHRCLGVLCSFGRSFVSSQRFCACSCEILCVVVLSIAISLRFFFQVIRVPQCAFSTLVAVLRFMLKI